MIKVQNNIATREPLPSFLQGLAPESLADLSWTDPQLGVQGCAWWPERDDTPALGPDQVYDGSEVLTAEANTRQVTVVRGIRNMTTEELHERWLAENPVPQEVPRYCGRMALKRHRLVEGVLQELAQDEGDAPDSLLAALMDCRNDMAPSKERDDLDAGLNDVVHYLITSPLVESMRLLLGLRIEHVHALFRWAKSYEASI